MQRKDAVSEWHGLTQKVQRVAEQLIGCHVVVDSVFTQKVRQRHGRQEAIETARTLWENHVGEMQQ